MNYYWSMNKLINLYEFIQAIKLWGFEALGLWDDAVEGPGCTSNYTECLRYLWVPGILELACFSNTLAGLVWSDSLGRICLDFRFLLDVGPQYRTAYSLKAGGNTCSTTPIKTWRTHAELCTLTFSDPDSKFETLHWTSCHPTSNLEHVQETCTLLWFDKGLPQLRVEGAG